MNVLHLIGGMEEAGSKNHLLNLLDNLNNDKDNIILGVFEKGAIYEEAVLLGIDVRHFGQNSRYDVSIISSIIDLIKKENISILHTHGPRANLFGYFLKKKLKDNIIWTTTVHSDPRYDFIDRGVKGKIFTKINLHVLKKTDHCFAISDLFHDTLRKLNIKSEITTIYNGIDFNKQHIQYFTRESLNLNPEDFVITTIGRLHPIKGHSFAIESILKIRNTTPNIKYLIVGNGDLEHKLKSLVEKLDLSDNVFFLGFQSEEKIHSILEISDLFLLSSLSESFPLVVLESARASTPVIATDVGGVRDLITDTSLGWVIDHSSSDEITEAVLDAYSNKASLSQIGQNLKEKASTNYSDKQLSGTVYKTYLKLLS